MMSRVVMLLEISAIVALMITIVLVSAEVSSLISRDVLRVERFLPKPLYVS